MNPNDNQGNAQIESGLQAIAAAIQGNKASTINANRQDDTTNTIGQAMKIQSGWGRMTFGGTNAYLTEAVTFPESFVGTPIVVVSHAGDRSNAQGVGTLETAGNNVHGQVYGASYGISKTGFSVKAGTSAAGGNYSAGDTLYYTWIAIGV